MRRFRTIPIGLTPTFIEIETEVSHFLVS
jgi:hypothetical protein